MAVQREGFNREALKSPRAAAVAGIVFALLYGSSTILIRSAIPGDPASATALNAQRADTISLALNLVPYAGIAFLWFVGVIRDRLGDSEDRLFATVFLGSSLLFLAMTFIGAALAGGLLRTYESAPAAVTESGVMLFARQVMFDVVNIYAIRMAGVTMLTLATIWLRTGLMRRIWAIVTYLLALALLVSVSYTLWTVLLFPAWVFAVSAYMLFLSFRNQASGATEDAAPPQGR